MRFSQRLAVNLVSGGGLLLLIGAMAWAADDPVAERIAKFLETERRTRTAKLARLDDTIAGLEAHRKVVEAAVVRRGVSKPATDKRPAVYSSLNAKAAALSQVDAELLNAQAKRASVAESPLTQPYIEALKIGEAGRFPGWKFRVVQIIDGKTMLASVESLGTFMLRGMATDSFADDSEIETVNYFEVTGTESYTTAIGAKRTVFVVRPFDEKRLEAVKKKAE